MFSRLIVWQANGHRSANRKRTWGNILSLSSFKAWANEKCWINIHFHAKSSNQAYYYEMGWPNDIKHHHTFCRLERSGLNLTEWCTCVCLTFVDDPDKGSKHHTTYMKSKEMYARVWWKVRLALNSIKYQHTTAYSIHHDTSSNRVAKG